MMQPVSRFNGQPISSFTPWASLSWDSTLRWVWLTSCSAATPPVFLIPQHVWSPEHTHLTQLECPTVDIDPVLPQFVQTSPLPLPHHLHKRRRLPTNQLIPATPDHASRVRHLFQPHLTGCIRRNIKKRARSGPEGSSSAPRLQLLFSSHHPPLTPPAAVDVASGEWVEFQPQSSRGAWSTHSNHRYQPVFQLSMGRAPPVQLSCVHCPVFPVQLHPSGVPLRLSPKWIVHRDKRQRKTLGELEKRLEDESLVSPQVSPPVWTLLSPQSVGADRAGEEEEEKPSEKGPVASAPVPGSPWCVVWTADDRIFFFNSTMHLSVWERPGDLTGRDISAIIQNPPHRPKKTPGRCGHQAEDQWKSKRNRLEKTGSLSPEPEEIQKLPLELRKTHFTEMMLERGVSAFSRWDKELHKMVFDPRYLLLTLDQRKQVFDQFVKSRMKEEFREKKNKELKAREEFRRLLQEAKVTSRSTFREFCTRYRGDQRFCALNRKKEQEVLFNHYITSIKKSAKENRSRLRKMR